MKYCVKHKPIPLSRPRFGQGRVYDPQKEERIFYSISLDHQHKNRPLLAGPLALDVTFFMPIPPGMTVKRKAIIRGTHHHIRPDLSNLIKWIEDVAQNIIFKDDALIVSINAQKIYDDIPRTEFTIKELGQVDEEEKG